MKKFFAFITMVSISSFAFAQGQRPQHLVSVGTNGLGWSGVATVFEWDEDKSGINENESSNSNINLNYAYIFQNNFMIGAGLSVESEKSEIKDSAGDTFSEEEATTAVSLGVGYNFNDDLNNSWWITGSFTTGSVRTESRDPTATPVNSDSKSSFSGFEIAVGKRISLSSWGLGNISYSPSIEFGSIAFSDDAEDAGLESASAVALNILKFDILF